jgi:hypothetical protein
MDIERITLLPVFEKESANLANFSDDYILDFMRILVNADHQPIIVFHDTFMTILKTRPHLAEKIKKHLTEK